MRRRFWYLYHKYQMLAMHVPNGYMDWYFLSFQIKRYFLIHRHFTCPQCSQKALANSLTISVSMLIKKVCCLADIRHLMQLSHQSQCQLGIQKWSLLLDWYLKNALATTRYQELIIEKKVSRMTRFTYIYPKVSCFPVRIFLWNRFFILLMLSLNDPTHT